MRNPRVIASTLALVLMAAACAGDLPVRSTGGGPTSTSVPGGARSSTTSTTVVASAPPTTPPPTTPPAPALPEGQDTTVESVVDGDTIVVAGGTRVRLIGVDTPETKDPRTAVQCFGREAGAHTASLLGSGTPVRLVYDAERHDRYGRTLAYVYRRSDGLFVNAALVAGGYALVTTFAPNVAHAEEFIALARAAREDGRGLWAACGGDPSGAPAPPPAPSPPPAAGGPCDASYPGVCIPTAPPDLDCGDVAERRFAVVPPDPHRFDGDGDGVGCES